MATTTSSLQPLPHHLLLLAVLYLMQSAHAQMQLKGWGRLTPQQLQGAAAEMAAAVCAAWHPWLWSYLSHL